MGRKLASRPVSMTRLLNFCFLLMLVGLQAKWWFGQGGLSENWRLQKAIEVQIEKNHALHSRNHTLAAEVRDLKVGTEALEERARNEFGLVRADEEFYQVVQRR